MRKRRETGKFGVWFLVWMGWDVIFFLFVLVLGLDAALFVSLCFLFTFTAKILSRDALSNKEVYVSI